MAEAITYITFAVVGIVIARKGYHDPSVNSFGVGWFLCALIIAMIRWFTYLLGGN